MAALFKKGLSVLSTKSSSLSTSSTIRPSLLFRTPSRYFAAAIGGSAPSFTATAVVNGRFETINLDDYKGKYIVLFFYPLDFTFVCPTEIVEFSDRIKEFDERRCVVLGASVDSQFTHLAFMETVKLTIILNSVSISFKHKIT